MTKKTKKPIDWEKVCMNLNTALMKSIDEEDALKQKIEDLEAQIEQLEEQLTMSVGVIKYLEMKLNERTNSV
jgi:phage shock protein A